MYCSAVLMFAAILGTHARSLLEAIGQNPSLSNFTAFYSANEPFANLLFNNQSLWPITVLIPNDQAFATYLQATGVSLMDLPADTLLPLVQYHTLASSLGADNFSSPDGMTVPTQLNDAQYNNRSVGTSLAEKFGGPGKSGGQVVFIKMSTASSTKKFFLSRQEGGSSGDSVRSGLGSDVNLTALDDTDSTWKGGKFHIIDGLLMPPQPCSSTIRSAGLTSLDNAVNRTKLWSSLDHGTNLTCLGPSNEAFKAAGSADSTLNETELSDALRHHTLPEVAYSDFLSDGQEFTTLQNTTIRVTITGTGADRQIFFNNAKVINANVLANNGLMHIVDQVIKPLDQIKATASSSPTPSATASNTAAASSGVAATNTIRGHVRSLLIAAGGLAVLI